MDFVAIAYPFVDGAGTPYIKGMDKKRLTCGPTDNMVGVHLDYIKMENNNAPECGNTAEASNHNVNEAYTMACQHSTQTRPKFVYLFLASYPSGGKPIMLRTEANSELEARLRVAGDYSLTFAAQIRTESPCVIHRYCEEADLTSTYICNKADAHPVCNAGKNSFYVNPCQPRPEAHHV
ncbi:TPA: host cell division inhibitor Icd-like protein [Serratia fonticola]